MGELRVDTTFLVELGDRLEVVADEFKNANSRSDSTAEACGHSGLADAVREFAHNWDDRREEMLKNLSTLAGSAGAIGESFEKVDRELARALEEA